MKAASRGFYFALIERSRAVFSGKWLPIILAASIIPFLIIQLSNAMSHIFAVNDDWSRRATSEIGGTVTGDLFERALQFGLIAYDLSSDRFSITTPREWSTRESIANYRDNDGYSPKIVLDLLWKTRGSGYDIRTQLDAYNRSSRYAAFRDNSGRLKTCKPLAVEDDSCRANLWKATVRPSNRLAETARPVSTGSEADFSLERLDGQTPPIGIFGGFARAQIPNFRNWYSVVGEEISGSDIVFFRPPGPAPSGTGKLIIDAVGSHFRISPALQSNARVSFYCWPSDPAEIAMEACSASAGAIAARFEFPASFAQRQITIRLKPVGLFGVPPSERSARFLPREKEARAQSSGRNTYELTNNVRLHCYTWQDRNRYCAAEWLSASSRVQLIPQVASANQEFITLRRSETEALEESQVSEALVAGDGNGLLFITEKGTALGLDSVIGQTSADRNTLLNLLAAPPGGLSPGDIELLLDPNLQEIVSRHFSDLLVRKSGLGDLGKGVAAKYDPFRRAGIVLIDLRKQSTAGAIVAATGYPYYDGNLSEWDLKAIREIDPSRDPLAPHGWGAIDSRYTPGSTFKLLAALSFIDAATGVTENVDQETGEILVRAMEGADSEFYDANLNETLRRAEVRLPKTNRIEDGFFTLSDSSHTPPLTNAFRLPSGTCGRPARNKQNKKGQVSVYGLCEAIAQSSNIWFAKMALRANRQRLEKFWQNAPLRERMPILVPTLRHIGLKTRWPLLSADLADGESLPPYVVADPVLAGSETVATLGPGPGRLAQLTTGLNGYGQDATASPLAIAALAATIGSGRVVTPFIAFDRTTHAPGEVLYEDNPDGERLLGLLRDGMHAVVNRSGGTAFRYFRSVEARKLAPRVFAKTGTPRLEGHGISDGTHVNGSWFAGWIGHGSQSRDPQPKFAFACGISHVVSGGSGICAQLMANILVDIEAAGY